MGGARVATLSDRGDGTYSLRLYKSGATNPVVQAGVLSSGDPGIIVGDGSNQFVRIEGQGGDGAVRLYKRGQEAITVGALSEGTTGLAVRDGDQQAVTAVGTEGAYTNLSNGSGQFFSVDADGGSAQLVLKKDDSRAWRMSALGTGILIEGKSDSKTVNLQIGVNTGLLVGTVDKPVAFIGEGGGKPTMSIFGPGTYPVLSAGYTESGQPAFRVRQDNGGKDLAVLTEAGTDHGELILLDPTGTVAKMGSMGGSGTLALSKSNQPTITLGPTPAKDLPQVRAYVGGKPVFAAGSAGASGYVMVGNGDNLVGAGMEAYKEGGDAVYVQSNGKELASINTTDKPGEGLVVVRSTAGTAVAALGYGSSGGGNVTVSDPSGNGVFSAGYDGGDGPGSACVEHKGTKCLGVGLTGMEGMH